MSTAVNPDDTSELAWKIIRRTFGVVSIVLFFLLFRVDRLPFVAVVFAVAGACALAPDLAGYLSRFMDNIVWSTKTAKRRPVYGPAESFVVREQFERAVEEYEKIVAEFPGDYKVHVDLITLAIVRMNDGDRAERFYQRGLQCLPDPESQKHLTAAYRKFRVILEDRAAKPQTIPTVAYRAADKEPRPARPRELKTGDGKA